MRIFIRLSPNTKKVLVNRINRNRIIQAEAVNTTKRSLTPMRSVFMGLISIAIAMVLISCWETPKSAVIIAALLALLIATAGDLKETTIYERIAIGPFAFVLCILLIQFCLAIWSFVGL